MKNYYAEESGFHLVSKKADGRLWPQYHLYCEGLPKPSLRGKLHLFCAVLLPLGLWHLLGEANNEFYGQLVAFVYIASNIFCYGVSGLYHCVTWSPRTEILMQKLDHVGIALLSCGTFFPLQVLLLSPVRPKVAALFFTMMIMCFLWVFYNIFYRMSPSVNRQVMVVATILPFLPIITPLLTNLEILCIALTFFFKGIGTLVYQYERPNPWPKTCGFHEIFHYFVVRDQYCSPIPYFLPSVAYRSTPSDWTSNPPVIPSSHHAQHVAFLIHKNDHLPE